MGRMDVALMPDGFGIENQCNPGSDSKEVAGVGRRSDSPVKQGED